MTLNFNEDAVGNQKSSMSKKMSINNFSTSLLSPEVKKTFFRQRRHSVVPGVKLQPIIFEGMNQRN